MTPTKWHAKPSKGWFSHIRNTFDKSKVFKLSCGGTLLLSQSIRAGPQRLLRVP
jgi:hypothetical protein